MKFFQKPLVPEPLGALLVQARQTRNLTSSEASRLSGIPLKEVLALEEDRITGAGTARLHAVSYARALGIDPMEIRDSLPKTPELLPSGSLYLSNMNRSGSGAPFRQFRRGLMMPFLAPLGRAAVWLLLTATLLSTWGMMRQLSRVRSIPWISCNSRPSSFSDR